MIRKEFIRKLAVFMSVSIVVVIATPKTHADGGELAPAMCKSPCGNIQCGGLTCTCDTKPSPPVCENNVN